MNQIEILRNLVASTIPNVTFELDRPANPQGSWWLDVHLGDQAASVEWKPGKGFGISASPSAGYGEGPHETFADAESVARRLVGLLERSEHTKSPKEAILTTP
jgi:hypothetical protein